LWEENNLNIKNKEEFSLSLKNKSSENSVLSEKDRENKEEIKISSQNPMDIASPLIGSENYLGFFKIWESVAEKVNKREITNSWNFIRNHCLNHKNLEIEEKQKITHQSLLKGASHAFSLMFKQLQKRIILHSFNEINKFWMEKKLEISQKNSFSLISQRDKHNLDTYELNTENMSKYKMFKLLQSSVSF